MTDQPRQLSLISDTEIASIVEQRATRDFQADEFNEGDYTLERFEAREPRLLQAVCSLRGAGMAIKDVGRLLNVGFKTIMAIDSKYADSIATRKQRVGRRYMEIAELAADAARDRLLSGSMAKESLRDIVVAGATAMDKALLASGEATEIRRVEFEAPGLADFSRQLAAMGLGSGMPSQKGTVDAEFSMVDADQGDGGLALLAPPREAVDLGGTDNQSAVSDAQVTTVQRLAVRGVIPVQSRGPKGADSDEDEDGEDEPDAGGRASVGVR